MRITDKTLKFIAKSVQAARAGQSIRIITSRRDAKHVHALLAKHEGGSRNGERWNFGPGSVEVVT